MFCIIKKMSKLSVVRWLWELDIYKLLGGCMGFQEIKSLLMMFGGGAAVAIALVAWIGKVQINRIHERDKYGFQKSLEEMKSQYVKDVESIKHSYDVVIEKYHSRLEAEVMKINLYNKTQFEHYNDIYSDLIDLKISAEELWEKVDGRSLTNFSKQLKKTHTTLQKGRLLLDDDDYQTMIKLICHFENFRVGKKQLLEFRNQRIYENENENVTYYGEERIIDENGKELNELKSLIESISISIKNRLKGSI